MTNLTDLSETQDHTSANVSGHPRCAAAELRAARGHLKVIRRFFSKVSLGFLCTSCLDCSIIKILIDVRSLNTLQESVTPSILALIFAHSKQRHPNTCTNKEVQKPSPANHQQTIKPPKKGPQKKNKRKRGKEKFQISPGKDFESPSDFLPPIPRPRRAWELHASQGASASEVFAPSAAFQSASDPFSHFFFSFQHLYMFSTPSSMIMVIGFWGSGFASRSCWEKDQATDLKTVELVRRYWFSRAFLFETSEHLRRTNTNLGHPAGGQRTA